MVLAKVLNGREVFAAGLKSVQKWRLWSFKMKKCSDTEHSSTADFTTAKKPFTLKSTSKFLPNNAPSLTHKASIHRQKNKEDRSLKIPCDEKKKKRKILLLSCCCPKQHPKIGSIPIIPLNVVSIDPSTHQPFAKGARTFFEPNNFPSRLQPFVVVVVCRKSSHHKRMTSGQ